MAYTQYSQEWLEDQDSIRIILVEVGVRISGVETTKYLSNSPYMTSNKLILFDSVISNNVSFTESISIDGSLSMSFGDIEVNNQNGDFDLWLNATHVWVNRDITVYIGDPRWVCTDTAEVRSKFLTVFTGVVADIDSKDRETINIKVRDKLEKLNTPISESTFGNTYYSGSGATQTNQLSIRPIVFGEVHNVTPILYDPSVIEYIVNDGKMERIIELRDNGAPIYNSILTSGATIDLNTGKFRLSQKLFGTLTASVQGIAKGINYTTHALTTTYSAIPTVATIILIICLAYGKDTTRLTTNDIDWTNFNTFNTNNPAAVGIFVDNKINTLEICQDIASSVGAQVYMNRLGKLQILRLGTYEPSGPVTTITDDDILHHSLSISAKTEVVAAVKLGYCKNWTVQTNLTTGIPEEHKSMYAETVTVNNSSDDTVAAIYKLNTEPTQVDTLLIQKTTADAEATRRLNMFKVPRIVYSFTGTTRLLSLVLGQQVTLKHNRFGLSNGVTGQVISLTPDWGKATVDVEVFI